MDDDICGKTRKALIDSQGSVHGIPTEFLEHLDSCRECSGFSAFLGGFPGTELASEKDPGGTSPADYRSVDLAFGKAGAIRKIRKEKGEFLAFAFAAFCLAFGFSLAAITGFEVFVIAFQGIAFCLLPFVGLAALQKRRKEAYHA